MSISNKELEEIDYFHHCTSEKDGQNIIDFGLVPYSADDTFYDGKLCVPGFPEIVFFACFKHNGKDITQTPYPRTLDEGQSPVMLKFNVDQFNYKDYILFGLEEQLVHNAKHKKIFMVHVNNKIGIDFAEDNNFQPLDIEKNNYQRYEEKKWYSTKYQKGGLIIDIVFFTKTAIDIVDDKNNVERTYQFNIVSNAIGINHGLQKISSLNGVSQTNHLLPFKISLLKTIITCLDDEINKFSMRINGKDFKTIPSLSQEGKIDIIGGKMISILTNLGELVTISIIHTKESPLSPLTDRKLKITDTNDQEDLSNKFNKAKINNN
ncbi:hypothetical protein ACTFIY_004145 [Dictyostelium cf. discoideum]